MKSWSRLLFCMVAIVTLAIMIVGCGPTENGADAEDELVIAGACPMTGDGAQYGEFLSRSLELAAEMINEKGGIEGKKIRIRMIDDQMLPSEAATVAEQLGVDDSVLAVVGHTTSTCTLAAVPIYDKYGLPVISHSSTNPDLSGSSKYFFRTCGTDEAFGYLGGEYAVKKLGAKKIVIMHALSDGPTSYANSFAKAVKDSGGEVLDILAHEDEEKDFTAELTLLRSLNPDLVLLSTWFTPAAMIIKQAKEANITGIEFMCMDSAYVVDFIELGGEAVEDVIMSAFFHPDLPYPSAQEYISRFKEKYNEPPEWSGATAFDALNLIAEAIRANGASREGIRDYLSQVGKEIDPFQGVTGETAFDDNGDVIKPAVFIVVKDGEFKLAEVQ